MDVPEDFVLAGFLLQVDGHVERTDGGTGTLGPATRVLPWRGEHPAAIMVEADAKGTGTP